MNKRNNQIQYQLTSKIMKHKKGTKLLGNPACLHHKFPHVQHQIIRERSQTSRPAHKMLFNQPTNLQTYLLPYSAHCTNTN